MLVFVYHTVKLFLDTGGVGDHKRSCWPRMVHIPQVINAVWSRIDQNPVQEKNKIMAEEMDFAARTIKKTNIRSLSWRFTC